MRRFSQRNSLVTLSDINITPLLDLAFVLLIIFVITTPLLDHSLNLKLPGGGQPDRRQLQKDDVKTVEVTARGEYTLNKVSMSLAQLEAELVKIHRARPNLAVDVRADEQVEWKHVVKVLDVCVNHNITQVAARTAPSRNK